MEVGKKEVIMFRKFDRDGKEMSSLPIYMIDEELANEYITMVRQKEEYKNSSLIKKFLPKELFQQVESRSVIKSNPVDQYKYEKDQQFKVYKYENEPYFLQNALTSIKIV